MSTATKQLYTESSTAEWLGIPVSRLRALAVAGQIECVHRGGERCYESTSVAAYRSRAAEKESVTSQWRNAIAHIKDRDKCSHFDASVRAGREFPDLVRQLNALD